jgi:hypothetical protein
VELGKPFEEVGYTRPSGGFHWNQRRIIILEGGARWGLGVDSLKPAISDITG